ncbi:unnamed protein product [Paramecium pentaurelia]|uniref:cystathionine gamma-lyase n=1 Tax=Paramecium pentaurelia TaxID=43138 RepID=A0A8S1TQI1_9CILI|nr:unnamed protein product [Paramecium pentaurelia]
MLVQEEDYLFDSEFTIATKTIHKTCDKTYGAVNPPIYMSSTFELKDVDSFGKGYFYTRCGNPTRTVVEEIVAEIEQNNYAIAFSSGMAAIQCVINLLKEGEEMLAMDDLYGGTVSYLRAIAMEKHGIKVKFVDMTNIDEVQKQMNENVKLVYLETPTNPTMKLTDIKELCQIVRQIKNNVIVAVDNTFATPYLQTPSILGADITLNSGTKYLGGHSDILFGTLSCRNKELYDDLFKISYLTGGCPSPFDCYLITRSLKTLEVRMKQQIKNAYILAKYLESHPKVEKVLYPGIESHPQYNLARKQMRAGGAMISFYIKGGAAEAERMMKGLELFTMAVSLGGVESLIQIPAKMTHSGLTESRRQELGITQNLIRLSAGLEHVSDLIKDLEHALKNI